MNPAVSVEHLVKSFGPGGPRVMDGVSFEVREKEIFFVLGPSGSGKTVLLKHLVGLIVPDSGTVRIFGRTIPYGDPVRLNETRTIFGYLFQGAALFDSMTVFQNMAFPLVERAGGIARKDVLPRVERALRSVGLDPSRILEQYPRELSGGMSKRVALARALVLEPRILLFDEPTTGLDPVVRATVDELIFETSRSLGVTSLVISHDVRSALSIADRIAFLQGGRILFQGTPDEFRESPNPALRDYLLADERRPRRESHAS